MNSEILYAGNRRKSEALGVRALHKSIGIGLLVLAMFWVITPFALAAEISGDTVIARITVNGAAFSKETGCIQDVLLGSLTADAVRDVADTDIALIPCGDFGDSSIGVKELTYDELQALFSADQEIGIAEISVPQLYEILEYAVSTVTLDDETKQIDQTASQSANFLQISGFEMIYDAAAPVGERLYEVTFNGEHLDLDSDEIITVAAGMGLFFGDYGFPVIDAEGIGVSYTDALLTYFESNSVISEYEDGRLTVIGQSGESIIDGFPIFAVVVVIVMFMMANLVVLRQKKAHMFETDNRFFKPKDSMID